MRSPPQASELGRKCVHVLHFQGVPDRDQARAVRLQEALAQRRWWVAAGHVVQPQEPAESQVVGTDPVAARWTGFGDDLQCLGQLANLEAEEEHAVPVGMAMKLA